MPKNIGNVKEKLLAEARRQTLENGYSNMTVRSVVEACGMSVGTFYNYYTSKETLTAAFLLEDWTRTLGRMRAICEGADDAMDAIGRVYAELLEFEGQYEKLFSDATAKKNASSQFYARHVMLRGQISAFIAGVCKRRAVSYTEFLPDFIAEALVTWSVEGRAFDDLAQVLCGLFGE